MCSFFFPPSFGFAGSDRGRRHELFGLPSFPPFLWYCPNGLPLPLSCWWRFRPVTGFAETPSLGFFPPLPLRSNEGFSPLSPRCFLHKSDPFSFFFPRLCLHFFSLFSPFPAFHALGGDGLIGNISDFASTFYQFLFFHLALLEGCCRILPSLFL